MKQDINPKYRKFVKLLDFSRGKYEIIEVFKDFVTVYAIAIKNGFHYDQKDEDIYFKTINKYKKTELNIFPKLIDELIRLYMQEQNIRDILGEIYFQIGAIKEESQQFFSPKELAIMSALIVNDYLCKKKEKFNIIYDPTCGSGTLLLYYANVLMSKGIDYAKEAFYLGQDIDFVCFCMSYIQMSLYGMPGLVILGNTLTLKTDKVFYTPEFFIGEWKQKIEERRKAKDGKNKDNSK